MSAYDKWYREPGFYWGTEPSRLARKLLELAGDVKAKRVVDLGCGEGKELIFFARHGMNVTGIDLSAAGLEKANRWAWEKGFSIETVHADIREFRLPHDVDFLYSSGTLQYLQPSIRSETFRHYKKRTCPGGIHAFNVFVEKPWISTAPDWQENEFFYHSGELLGYYRDWRILHVEEFEFDCMSSGVPHRHAVQVMIARKPEERW
jgi:tellurite methyltransferase